MEEDFKICKETIQKVKWYMNRKDYDGLRLYLDQQESYLEKHIIMAKNEEADYIDSLVSDLNKK